MSATPKMTEAEIVAYLEHLHNVVNHNANHTYGAGHAHSPQKFVELSRNPEVST